MPPPQPNSRHDEMVSERYHGMEFRFRAAPVESKRSPFVTKATKDRVLPPPSPVKEGKGAAMAQGYALPLASPAQQQENLAIARIFSEIAGIARRNSENRRRCCSSLRT